MLKKQKNTHDFVFVKLCELKCPVQIFLLSGVRLDGVIGRLDAKTLILNRDGQEQIIFIHAIATILPAPFP